MKEKKSQNKGAASPSLAKIAVLRVREAAKAQNYLQGKAMLENALNNPALSDAEKRTVQQQAQTKGIGAALGLLGVLAQAAWERYRAMDARIEENAAISRRVRLPTPPSTWRSGNSRTTPNPPAGSRRSLSGVSAGRAGRRTAAGEALVAAGRRLAAAEGRSAGAAGP
jgi:hypothetical protein